MKQCPRCGRNCQNQYENTCAECARAELALLRVDPFAFAAAFADETDRDATEVSDE
jgi:hypothetical protein